MRMTDIDAVIEIDRLSFPTPARANLFQYELEMNELAFYQVVTVDGEDPGQRVAGFAGFWMIADEVHISTIAVHPSWRGRGIGELLLLNLLFMANEKAAQLVTLEVRHSNLVAQALYRKYQFEVVGRRRRYYRDTGEDAVLMTVAALDAEYFCTLKQMSQRLFARLSCED